MELSIESELKKIWLSIEFSILKCECISFKRENRDAGDELTVYRSYNKVITGANLSHRCSTIINLTIN